MIAKAARVSARAVAAGLAAILATLVAGTAAGDGPGLAVGANGSIILSTTTSTQDSGLLDVLVPIFEKKTGIRVKTIAVGTGEALKMGSRGDADVVLVHAPAREKQYVADGSFVHRRLVMHNFFLVAGPPGDPAGLAQVPHVIDAFRAIAEKKETFVSRGDDSGTHTKEREIWAQVGIQPAGAWYLQTGQGMGATLLVAAEKDGYTLSDRGTYLAFKKSTGLAAYAQADPKLINIYSVMEVNPERFPKVKAAGARAFADFVVSAEAQGVISTFGVAEFGEPLFTPDAGKKEEELGG